MTKKDFINKFALQLGDVSKKDAEKYLGAFLETIESSLLAGEVVSFVGWGKWEVLERNAREVRNPQTGDKMNVPAKKVLKFRVGKTLEDKIAALPVAAKTEKKAKKAKK
ncbi:MAG: HU family DNA-binding protein [Fusobacteriaceae bacterium]